MSEIVKKWIFDELGIVLDNNKWSEDFELNLLAQVLHHYDLITDQQLETIQSGSGENYDSDLEYMRCVVNNLGINLSVDDLIDIKNGQEQLCATLFYELYLALHQKSMLHFILQRKVNAELNVNKNSKFLMTKCEEKKYENNKFQNPLGAPLRDKKNIDIIEWNKNKLNELTNKCKKSREDYLEYLKDKRLEKCKNVHDRTVEFESEKPKQKQCTEFNELELNFEKLLDEENRAKKMDCVKADPKIAQNFINSLRQKRRKQDTGRELKSVFQKMLMRNFWDKIIGEQDAYFKKEFSKKMLEQSVYEQQMATKLFEVRQQRDEIYENRFKLMETIKNEQEKTGIANILKATRADDMDRLNYYVERDRNLELHATVYAEKIRRKEKECDDICANALDDIIDIAFYNASYQEYYEEEISRRKRNDLAHLFIQGKPIFNILDNVADVINYNPDNNIDENAEDMICAEIDRQNCMDDMSFDEYCNMYWPWELGDLDVDEDSIRLGMEVVGYIVHRLLLAKYPTRALPKLTPMPKVDVAVCVNGLQEMQYLPALQNLLQARKIKIIEMQDVINYFLAIFKEETTVEYMDTVFVAETEKSLLKNDKKIDKKKKADKDKKPPKNKKGSQVIDISKTVEKEVQTPKIFPCEELVLSEAGEYGKVTFEVLNLGDSPNDKLLANMFVEYLKTLKDVEGWVLINYPQTVQQAAVLEETLTCVPVPKSFDDVPVDSILDMMEFEEREIEHNKSEDKFKYHRLSRLVSNPKPKEEFYYDTYLTAFIEVRSMDDDLDEFYYDCFKSIESDNALNQFYQDQGCKYTLRYKSIDFPTIKHLGKLILGDYALPRKTSLELFTNTVEYVETEWSSLTTKPTSVGEKIGSKKEKPAAKIKKSKSDKTEESGKKSKAKSDKSSKNDKKNKKGSKAGKKSIGLIEHEEKSTQFPEPPEVIIEPEEEPEEPPIPGEAKWIYVNLSIPELFEIALATLWENMEVTYISDIKQSFFRKRVLMDALLPYNTWIYNKLIDFICRPDEKQLYLQKFQIMYNEIDDDMREDDEVKAELHCRVDEFREKLCKICDFRMAESETERQRIVSENWLTELLYELVNIYITFLQLEIDRCSDTMQLIMDYYVSMITKMPSENRPLDKIQLTLISLSAIEDRDGGDHLMPYINYVDKIMMHPDEIINDQSPFHDLMNSNITTCFNTIDRYGSSAREVLQKLEGLFNPKAKTKTKPPSKGKCDENALPKFTEPEPEVKDRAADIMAEYTSSTTGEILRAKMRVELINQVFSKELEDCVSRTAATFRILYNKVKHTYNREIASIENACNLFARAIEAESKIQPELILEGDKFYIKIDNLMYEGELPEDEERLAESTDEEQFTTAQLGYIVKILFDLAPYGYMPERSFIFILQDLLKHNAEDGSPKYVPDLWSQLHPFKLNQFSFEFFGESEYIDWKDFIIYNLNVPFPSESDLIETRIQFRNLDPDNTELIYEYQFNEVKLWFENGFNLDIPEEQLKLKLIKELLLKLFKVDHSRFNYTALLLYFCKDNNPVIGFAKAIELTLGKYVCWDKTKGEMRYDYIMGLVMKQKMLELETQIEHKDNMIMAEEIVDSLIDTTVHKSTSAYLEEIEEEEQTQFVTENSEYERLLETEAEHFEDFFNDEYKYLNELANYSDFKEYESQISIFSNVSQGMESSDRIEYSMNFDTLINIITVAMPWHAKIQAAGNSSFRERVALIYQSNIDKELRMVFVHRFLNDPNFVELLEQVYKFKIKNPVGIIKQLLILE